MLTTRHLATVRAALQYWHEEMTPHGGDVMRPYFDVSNVEPLTANECRELRQMLRDAEVRYALYDPTRGRLAKLRLAQSLDEAQRRARRAQQVATVLIPVPAS